MTTSRGAVTVAAALLGLAAACSNNNNQPGAGTPDGGGVASNPDGGSADAGNGSLTTSTAAAADNDKLVFSLALDAAPSPDGNTIYFLAVDPANGPGVFKTAAAANSTPTLITSGGSLGSPLALAVSTDGNTIFLADPAAQTATDQGAIFAESAAGGAPSLLPETVDFAPRAVAVSKVGGSDEIVFIGTDKTSGADGVFKDVSGQVTSVVAGNNPSSIAVANDGTIYILDQAGSIARVAPGGTSATALAGASQHLDVSFPSGMDLSHDQSALLVSGFDPATGNESIARVDIATGAVTQLVLTPPLAGGEPGGLHRAANADTYGFVDTGAGNSGTVYLLK
ncbi:MAG TPA: hypothetical protein VGH20_20020 [Myxococcales bacterium]|jgi:hypothetical protein